MAKRNAAPSRLMSSPAAPIPNAREGGVKAGPGESRLLESSVTEWNDLAATGEVPPDNNQVIEDTKPDDEKQEQIRALLNRQLHTEDKPDEPAPAAAAAPAAAPVEEKPPVPAEPPATRKDIFGALASEKARLKLEGELREERKARKAAEDAVADPIAAARKRGLTTEQILDLALGTKDAPAAPAAPAIPPEVDKRLSAIEQREANLRQQQALQVVDSLTKELDIPVVRATQRVTVTDGNGGQTVMSGKELVLETAKRLWEMDGSPEGQNHHYIAKAAPLVEAQLIEDQKPAFEAYAAKRGAPAGGAAPVAKPKPEAPPALGRRTGGAGAQPAAALKLPDDEDERHTAIKARFGWR